MNRKSTRRALSRAAAEGIVSGLAVLASLDLTACSSQRSTSVNAPMETITPNASAARPVSFPIATPPGIASADPPLRDCCRGRNVCKGLSGCANDQNDCKGKNDCKGRGTACDSSDDDSSSPLTSAQKPGNCCAGRNECKGKSGCRSARNPAGPGMNDCKGKGTSCPRRR